ncbi:MAG: DUF4344 domain-containing metallopeptidase [Pseudomonadota bacterium]
MLYLRRIITGVFLALSPTAGAAQSEMSQFTQDALLHVVAHEIAHALIREFDLPVLGNEETIADDFATVFVHSALPDRAGDIIRARATWLSEEDYQESVFAEHNSDARRAGRAICMLYGLHPARHQDLADDFGMTEDQAYICRDTAPEIARAWRRTLAPLYIPSDARVTEARVLVGDGRYKRALEQNGLLLTSAQLLQRFDWHALITLHFDECDGSASWRRNGRLIRICYDYIDLIERYAP